MTASARVAMASHASGLTVYPIAAARVVIPWYVDGSPSLSFNQVNIIRMGLGVNIETISNIEEIISLFNTILRLLVFLLDLGASTFLKRLFSGLTSRILCGLIRVCPDDMLYFIWVNIKMNERLPNPNTSNTRIDKRSYDEESDSWWDFLPNLIIGDVYSKAF